MRVLEWFRLGSNLRFSLFVLLLYFSFSFSLLLAWPPPMIDEGLFGSTAKTLLAEGHLGTSLVAGLEDYVYWQPPVYFFVLAGVISIGGYSLVALRIFSILLGGCALLLVFILGLRFAHRAAARMGMLLLACDPKFVNSVKYARMDGLCVVLMLAALLVFVRPVFEDRRWNFLAAGFLCALAVFTHPLGVIAPLSLCAYIVTRTSIDWRERLRQVFLVLVPVIVGGILWGAYILQHTDSFVEQITYQLSRKDRPLVLTIANFIRQYRHFPFVLLLPLLGLWFVVVKSVRQRGIATLVALFLGIAFLLVVPKFENPYHVYLAPIGAIASGMLLTGLWERKGRLPRFLGTSMWSATMLNAAAVFGYLFIQFHAQLGFNSTYDRFCDEVANRIPANAAVCAWGTPCVYWRLQEDRHDIKYLDAAFLDSAKANAVIQRSNYAVLTRAFNVSEDEAGMKKQRESFKELSRRNGFRLLPVALVGEKNSYEYSAEIFRVTKVGNQ